MTEFRELEKRKYVAGDIKKIHIRSEDKGRGLDGMGGDVYSYCHCDHTIGIVGVAKINNNTCEVGIILDECSKRYTREIYFYAFQFLNDLQLHYARIQTTVRTDWSTAIKFMERLGFKREGLMKKFTAENDFYLYARVK